MFQVPFRVELLISIDTIDTDVASLKADSESSKTEMVPVLATID